MQLLIMAKEPRAGRVKTRLCPPCTPAQAAAVAEAALADTLAAAGGAGADRVVVALDGDRGPWLTAGVAVIPQRGDTFADRLEDAWSELGGPTFQIGMDTPQLTPADLAAAMEATCCAGPGGAVLGPAPDGGWWGLGLCRPPTGMFAGVAMSTASTGAAQRARLEALDRRVVDLDAHRDIDTVDDLVAVASGMTGGHLVEVVATLDLPAGAVRG